MNDSITYRGQLRPPYSDRYTELRGAGLWVRFKKLGWWWSTGLVLGGFVWFVGVVWTIALIQLLGKGFIYLAGFVGVVQFLRARAATCPYCDHPLGSASQDTLVQSRTNRQLECGGCHEWLVSKQGVIRALKPREAARLDGFDAPVFERGSWPDECIVCGKPPSHYEQASKTKLDLAELAGGTVSMKSQTIYNIPYCRDHDDAVSMAIRGDEPRLEFSDYAARRRYVHLNRGFEAMKFRSTMGQFWHELRR